MSRKFIQEQRGDVRKETIDIYNHIDKKELKECYLAHIPQLGGLESAECQVEAVQA
jgi:hypothetical protein